MTFLGEDHFRYLVQEIFVESSYMFTAEDNAPRILDCGSNTGLSVPYFKCLYLNARIIAFEPDPDTFAVLQKNIARNLLTDVVAHQLAIADREGAVEFQKSPEDDGTLTMSMDKLRSSGTTIQVPATRLVRFLEEPVDLLKMDIEGAEEQVLADLHKARAFGNVKKIHLEYHHHVHHEHDTLASILQILEANGFGYQIRASQHRWPTAGDFQDISIYAYRKTGPDRLT